MEDLHKELAGRLGYPESRLVRLMLKRLAPDDQARIILELPAPSEEIASALSVSKQEVESDPKRYQAEMIAEKLNLDKGTVDNHLQELFEKGAIVPTRKGYRFHRNIMALRDSMSNPKFDDELGEEFWAIWYGIHQNEWLDWMTRSRRARSPFTSRIIPRWRAIEDIPDKVPYEYLPDMLKTVSLISVCQCPCQKAMWTTVPAPLETCINFNRTAEYQISRGSGRKISVEETLAICDSVNGGEGWAPKLHVASNRRTLDVLLCNCNTEICGPMYWALKTGTPLYTEWQRTRYEVEVDPEKCRVCQLCVERCPTGASQLKAYPGITTWKAYVDPEKCLGCGVCVVNCPARARQLKLVRPPEWIPEMEEHYRPYGTAIT